MAAGRLFLVAVACCCGCFIGRDWGMSHSIESRSFVTGGISSSLNYTMAEHTDVSAREHLSISGPSGCKLHLAVWDANTAVCGSLEIYVESFVVAAQAGLRRSIAVLFLSVAVGNRTPTADVGFANFDVCELETRLFLTK